MFEKFKNNIAIGVVAILALVGSFYTGMQFGGNETRSVAEITELSNKETGKPATVDFSPFWQVWSLIDEKFVGKGTTTAVSDQDKVWGAIEGLSASLGDPFTIFLPPEEHKSFQTEISGSFEGIGMEIGNKDGALIVIAPLKDTPAYRAGILPGDIILKIDDKQAVDMPSDQAVKIIRGAKGTPVRLLIQRESKKAPFEITVIRDKIQIPTIDTKVETSSSSSGESTEGDDGLRDDGVFLISLYNFSEPSPALFQNALRQFMQTGSDKLILDLRNNPGGYLSAAIDMASWFLPTGKAVVQEDFGGKREPIVHRSIGRNVFANRNLKMVILVNGGSASASEILAGALQEYGIAKLVGTKTFGKGSVQELIPITSDTSFKVTIAKWLTPNGRSISDGGLTPDYVVEITDKDREAGKDRQLEKALELLLK